MSELERVTIYTDGACSGNPGPGGYAAIIVTYDDKGNVLAERCVTGGKPRTTNNQMELLAAIEGLKALDRTSQVTVTSDSQYLVNTMTKGWKRKKNQDLWDEIDMLCAKHRVTWKYVRGHAGHEYNERCDRLAVAEIEKVRRHQSGS